jgi:hypothetical protein
MMIYHNLSKKYPVLCSYDLSRGGSGDGVCTDSLLQTDACPGRGSLVSNVFAHLTNLLVGPLFRSTLARRRRKEIPSRHHTIPSESCRLLHVAQHTLDERGPVRNRQWHTARKGFMGKAKKKKAICYESPSTPPCTRR